ncbi:hypothetical protein M433DRAFT_2814 [Acidomyces richmondensis BFW]|nr:MAG: hypothetical protein FE78DRAFT_28906 [Acidomyces sp. 'richmondensis']KYG47456.1 hypothetical protein M433DRAFT_2814 [Acidomyces richmondensis BFW]
MPDIAPDGPLDGQKGLLSPIGDPLGQVLDKGLKPVGVLTGAIGRPSGEALQNVEKQAKKEKGYQGGYHDYEKAEAMENAGGERIGGKEQTGQNPLGL